MRRFVFTMAIAITASGCAHRGANYVPIVDHYGKDAYQLQRDTRECQSFATQRPNAQTAAVVGAVLGAVIMAVIAGGGRSYNPGAWAAGGAIAGGAGAAQGAQEAQEDIIKRCLAGRGYSVLN